MIDQLTNILAFILVAAFIFKYWIWIILLFLVLFIVIYLLC